ncbi:MAG: homocysteine S-methyltransferase family protein [Halofilum sp. (in: g-proteobacteria)]|nr:homocysteine S-methyltransferase family protein [Halofilum sp. (in: g-proteobacteria)]
MADRHGVLMAGNICNTNVYEANDAETHRSVRAMFDEQVRWAVEEADDLIAETLDWAGEAETALEAMKATGLPSVVTLSAHRNPETFDGVHVVDACRRLEARGADVVGLNCHRGPVTLMPLIRAVREAVSTHLAALPVPYRTSEAEPTFQSLTDHECACIPGDRPFPTALDPFTWQPLRVCVIRAGLRRTRRQRRRPVLRCARHDPGHGRGPRAHAGGQPLFAGHVTPRIPRR